MEARRLAMCFSFFDALRSTSRDNSPSLLPTPRDGAVIPAEAPFVICPTRKRDLSKKICPTRSTAKKQFNKKPRSKPVTAFNEWQIATSPDGGRPMGQTEYERIFQLVRGPDSTAIPDCALADIRLNRSVAEVFAEIEREDRRPRRLDEPAHEMLNWRKPLNRPGTQGENVSIAQQCVYVGAVSYVHRRPKTVEVLKYLLDTDEDLAWGRVRFNTGLMPMWKQYTESTLFLACSKARPDIVKTLLDHPSAEYYLPTACTPDQVPIQRTQLMDLIEEVRKYGGPNGNAINKHHYSDAKMADLWECERLLVEFHQRRHGEEQEMLEKVMLSKLNTGEMLSQGLSEGLLTY